MAFITVLIIIQGMMFITDRVRNTREGYVLKRVCPSIHPSVCPHLGGGIPQPGPGRGVPLPGPAGWGVPQQGVPHLEDPLPPPPPSDLSRGVPRWQGGYPISSSTWYATVGMPLAFTQEDFLVIYVTETATGHWLRAITWFQNKIVYLLENCLFPGFLGNKLLDFTLMVCIISVSQSEGFLLMTSQGRFPFVYFGLLDNAFVFSLFLPV